jgi:3-oxoacyl-[acyl-carrier-protein] synthase III
LDSIVVVAVRKSGTTTLAMAVEARRDALGDAGLLVKDVDGMVSFSTGDSVSIGSVGYSLGLEGLYFQSDVGGGGNVAALVMSHAFMAVESGNCDVAVVCRSLNSRSGQRFGMFARPMQARGDSPFSAPTENFHT